MYNLEFQFAFDMGRRAITERTLAVCETTDHIQMHGEGVSGGILDGRMFDAQRCTTAIARAGKNRWI